MHSTKLYGLSLDILVLQACEHIRKIAKVNDLANCITLNNKHY